MSLIDGPASNIEVFTRELTARDCVLLTSFAPYSTQNHWMFYRQPGRPGRRSSPLPTPPVSRAAQAADCTLLFLHRQSVIFPFREISGVAWRECLLAMLVVRHGREAVSKIENAERYLIESGAYVIPGRVPDK